MFFKEDKPDGRNFLVLQIVFQADRDGIVLKSDYSSSIENASGKVRLCSQSTA
jgi:hypothetical protein